VSDKPLTEPFVSNGRLRLIGVQEIQQSAKGLLSAYQGFLWSSRIVLFFAAIRNAI